MKLLNFWENGTVRLGVKEEAGVLDVAAALQLKPAAGVPATFSELVAGGAAALDQLARFAGGAAADQEAGYWKDEAGLQFAPCVPAPGKIICIGLNYRRHALETGMRLPEYPILFSKYANSLAGHGEAVPVPRHTQKVDYEAELAIVIGQTARNITPEEADAAIFGYCAANDLSARDLQMRTSQWLAGKSCDKFAPVGPYVVTADEVGNPQSLKIRCYVNGELRQDSNTADMIFGCRQIVSYISECMTLEPGDLILTGTPEGVMMGYPAERQIYLQPGDEVSVEIEKLGTLSNTMVSE
ncbi:fumarylacetoacetate hydrolase family protein ['Paenibacillus yunnanensis' Narsing Rao et al. 2020]|uniref:fumarylacetoacetate hydrolase family protein n=1 Tax=Paenibacillus tengchongensis TaxID=2608684 RepID=UPI00124EACC1|nr:fumarylacetoacetate hydrolase family protein [Paenibacillus tengchongensis]